MALGPAVCGPRTASGSFESPTRQNASQSDFREVSSLGARWGEWKKLRGFERIIVGTKRLASREPLAGGADAEVLRLEPSEIDEFHRTIEGQLEAAA